MLMISSRTGGIITTRLKGDGGSGREPVRINHITIRRMLTDNFVAGGVKDRIGDHLFNEVSGDIVNLRLPYNLTQHLHTGGGRNVMSFTLEGRCSDEGG